MRKNKRTLFCGTALILLLAGEKNVSQSQVFDPTNTVPLTAGTLYVDLRAVNAAPGVWTNLGSLGNFTAIGNPTLITNVAGTGATVPGVAFDGANDAYEGPNSVGDIDGTSDRSIEVWALNPSLEDEETTVSWGHRGVLRRNLAFGFGANSGYGAASHYGDDFGWNVNPTANATAFIRSKPATI